MLFCFMKNDSYVSIKQVLDNLLDHPLLKDLSFERAVNYAVHFIRLVGCPQIFIEKTETLEVKNYRAVLPCDFYKIIQVRACKGDTVEYLRYSSDNFHMSPDKHVNLPDVTYKLQNNIIYVSFKEGTIEISYRAIHTDEEGYPLIPDNSAFIRALELYIKKQQFTILFDQSKITQAAYQNVQQEYAWAVGQAQSELVKPDIDQMEAFTNSWNTLLVRRSHSSGFVVDGTRERIKVH